MSEATQSLARSREALVSQIARHERRHDPHEVPGSEGGADTARAGEGRPLAGSGWFDRARRAVTVWWRHQPAHMAAEVASPLVEAYGRRYPARLVGIAAVGGAIVVFARPWRLITLTGVLLAIFKSLNLPGLLMSALSATDFGRDARDPGG